MRVCQLIPNYSFKIVSWYIILFLITPNLGTRTLTTDLLQLIQTKSECICHKVWNIMRDCLLKSEMSFHSFLIILCYFDKKMNFRFSLFNHVYLAKKLYFTRSTVFLILGNFNVNHLIIVVKWGVSFQKWSWGSGYMIRLVFWAYRVQSWSLNPRSLSVGIIRHWKNLLGLPHDSDSGLMAC